MANYSKTRNRDHDIFIKGILKINELALLLLYRFIPEDLKQYIDFSTFRLFPESLIDNKLVAQYTDSIHECDLLKIKLPPHIQNMPDLPHFRFCFLWEHKSSKPYEPIEAQVERYRYALITSDLKNGRTPSIIIPIILYHGETKWTKEMVSDVFESHLPPEILKYLPIPRYIFIDISGMSDAEIEEMVDLKMLRAAFIALKYAHDPQFFQQNLEEILKFVEDSSSQIVFQSFFKMLLEYAQRRSKLEADVFNEIVEQKLEPNMATNIKTIFEVAEEKAELRGVQKGKVEGKIEGKLEGKIEGKLEGEQIGKLSQARIAAVNMLKMGLFSTEQIADILAVEIEFVMSIQNELARNPNLKE